MLHRGPHSSRFGVTLWESSEMVQLQNSALTAVEDCDAPPSGLAGALHGFISFCLEGGIHLWVQLTGKLVRKGDAPWLVGPLGGRERIGTGIYERAAEYQLDVWSEVSLTGRFFLWLLVEFISRRMDQLNFPISSLEVAKGMTSEVVQLVEPA